MLKKCPPFKGRALCGCELVEEPRLTVTIPGVFGFDAADRTGDTAHHDGVTNGDAVSEGLNPMKHGAVGHPGGGEVGIVAGNEIVEGHDTVGVNPLFLDCLTLFIPGDERPTLHVTAQGFDSAGGCDSFRGTTTAKQHVSASAVHASDKGAGDVAVTDQVDASTGVADRLDDGVVAVPFEDRDDDAGYRDVEGASDLDDIVFRRGGDVDLASGLPTDDDLVEVEEIPHIDHRAARCDGDDGDRAFPAFGQDGSAINRIDSDIGFYTETVTDRLAIVEHRRFVFFTLADDDDAIHVDSCQHGVHGVNGCLVGAVLVSPPEPTDCGKCRSLGDTNELHADVTIGSRSVVANYGRSGWNSGGSDGLVLLFLSVNVLVTPRQSLASKTEEF